MDILTKQEKENIAKRAELKGRTKDIDIAARGLTNFIFREGPIEDMHSNNQLSQDDMKQLNIFMVNRLAFILAFIIE
jgi:hypothetical protein